MSLNGLNRAVYNETHQGLQKAKSPAIHASDDQVVMSVQRDIADLGRKMWDERHCQLRILKQLLQQKARLDLVMHRKKIVEGE